MQTCHQRDRVMDKNGSLPNSGRSPIGGNTSKLPTPTAQIESYSVLTLALVDWGRERSTSSVRDGGDLYPRSHLGLPSTAGGQQLIDQY